MVERPVRCRITGRKKFFLLFSLGFSREDRRRRARLTFDPTRRSETRRVLLVDL